MFFQNKFFSIINFKKVIFLTKINFVYIKTISTFAPTKKGSMFFVF